MANGMVAQKNVPPRFIPREYVCKCGVSFLRRCGNNKSCAKCSHEKRLEHSRKHRRLKSLLFVGPPKPKKKPAKADFGYAKCRACDLQFHKICGGQAYCSNDCYSLFKRQMSMIRQLRPKHFRCKRCSCEIVGKWGQTICEACKRIKNKEQNKKWRASNAERLKAYEASRCKEAAKARAKASREKDREKSRKMARDWYWSNREVAIKRSSARNAERIKNNPRARLEHRLGNSIIKEMKRRGTTKSKRTLEYVGCTASELMNYLLSHPNNVNGDFTAENYGCYWHIDHVRPLASFSDAEVQSAWGIQNLQPMAAKDNLSKGSSWDGVRWRRKLLDTDLSCVNTLNIKLNRK